MAAQAAFVYSRERISPIRRATGDTWLHTIRRKKMTREHVISVIKQAAEESGHAPSMTELLKAKRISQYDVRKHFGVYASALNACGLEGQGSGYDLNMRQLFTDWA